MTLSTTAALVAELRARAVHRAEFHNLQPHTDIKLDAADLPEARAADMIEGADREHLFSPFGKKRSFAVAAASQATDAAAELLRFAREGEGLHGTFETEVIEQLLDAAKMAIELLGESEEAIRFFDIYRAIAGELEGWA